MVIFSDVADSQPSGGVPQFLESCAALLVGGDQQDRYLHRVAEMNLSQVADVALAGKGRTMAFLHIAGPIPSLSHNSSMARSNITL